jgi:hypothetical protein
MLIKFNNEITHGAKISRRHPVCSSAMIGAIVKTSKIIFCAFQFLGFFIGKAIMKDSEMNGSKHFPKFICS